MSQELQVLFAGIKPGQDVDRAQRQLADVLSLSAEELREMLGRVPLVLRSGLDDEEALLLRDRVRAAGGVCRVAPAGADPAGPSSEWYASAEDRTQRVTPSPPRAAPPSPPQRAVATCPKCGYRAYERSDPLLTAFAGQGECPACGIIVNKYRPAEPGEQAEEGLGDPDGAEASRAARGSGANLRPWLAAGAVASVLAGASLLLIWMGFAEAPTEAPPALSSAEESALNAAASAAFLAAEQLIANREVLPVDEPFADPALFLPKSLRKDPWQTPYRIALSGLSDPVLVTAGPNQEFELEGLGADDLVVVAGRENRILSLRDPPAKLFAVATERRVTLILGLLLNSEDSEIATKTVTWLKDQGEGLRPLR